MFSKLSDKSAVRLTVTFRYVIDASFPLFTHGNLCITLEHFSDSHDGVGKYWSLDIQKVTLCTRQVLFTRSQLQNRAHVLIFGLYVVGWFRKSFNEYMQPTKRFWLYTGQSMIKTDFPPIF